MLKEVFVHKSINFHRNCIQHLENINFGINCLVFWIPVCTIFVTEQDTQTHTQNCITSTKTRCSFHAPCSFGGSDTSVSISGLSDRSEAIPLCVRPVARTTAALIIQCNPNTTNSFTDTAHILHIENHPTQIQYTYSLFVREAVS